MSSASNVTAIPLVDLSIQHAQIADEVASGFGRVISSGAFVLGPDVREFEREYAAYSRVTHCVGLASGTDAIELALRAASVGAGDEVIIPANTFVATAGAVARTGARPVLVDADPTYLLIDPSQIEGRITNRTKAILPVHLFGQMAPMAPIVDIAQRHGLIVIEDGAQSQGAQQNGLPAGHFGHSAATSFYPGKNLGAYGDAGAVVTQDESVATALHGLRNHGGTVKYQHPELGFNSRLDTLQAVVLRAKLTHLDVWNEQRRVAAEWYSSALADVEGVTTPNTLHGNTHVWHLYVVQVDDRDRILATLNAAGIGAGIHYPLPIHLQGAYRSLGHIKGAFPNAEAAADRILSLPIYPGISTTQQQRVVDILNSAVTGEVGVRQFS